VGEDAQERQRRRVLDVAGELLAEHGFDGVTMSDIAERAGVARATVFNYFGSKYALVEELTEEVLDTYRMLLDDALADEERSTPELIRSLYEDMGKGIESERQFFRAIFREIARIRLGLDEGEVAQRANEEAMTRLRRLIERGRQRGDLTHDLDAETLAQAMSSLANGTITHWLYQDASEPLVDRMRAAAEVLLSRVEVTP
jgi:AcrR family transcriptional regulator